MNLHSKIIRLSLLSTALITPAVLIGLNPVTNSAMAADTADHDSHDHAQPTGDGDTVIRWTCPMHPQIVEDEPGSCPICGMDLVQKEYPAQQQGAAADSHVDHADHGNEQTAPQAAVGQSGGETVIHWTCPMHPQIIEDEPGSCPICGMDLVQKEYPASEVSADSVPTADQQAARPKAPSFPAVSVAPITVQHMNVVIEMAKERELAETIRTVGTVGYDEDLLTHVHSRTKGWVERLKIASVGATVKKGDVLLEYYSPDIVAAQQDYLVAQRRGMSDLIESTRARLELLDVPAPVIDSIRRQGKVQRTIPLLAPQDGYVAEINLREGMYITPGLDLYTIARRDQVWVNVDVLERRMQAVSEGQRAHMRVDGLPGREFEGTVDFVYPELDPQSRTLRVRLAFDNADGLLRPNQFAEVTLTPAKIPAVLTVPSTAIIPAPGGARVVVRTGEGRFRPIAVKTGVEADGYIEIVSGLQAGEQVVASGQFLIDSESNVQAAFSRLSGNEQ